MTKESIFQLVKDNIVTILPHLSTADIKREESLRDLGANSIDRMDIIVQVMEALKIKIPLIEFSRANNIQGLVDLLHEKKTSGLT